MGLRGTAQYHWVKAFGVIDEDKRDPAKIAELKQKGVYAIKAYSVESIYYHPELQRKAVEKLCEATREDSNQALSNTKEEALKALMEAKDHLCKKVAEKKIRTIIESKMPTKKEVAAGVDYNIPVEIKQVISEEAAFFDELMGGKNLEALICRYPIRESQLITNVVKNLNFANKEQYQGAVRNAIKDDVNVLAFVRNLFGSLYNDIIE